MGVWKKVGQLKYRLNHFAISWDTYNNFAGLANIREDIELSHDAATFSGTFRIEQFDAAGSNSVIIHREVAGQRITVSTTVDQLI